MVFFTAHNGIFQGLDSGPFHNHDVDPFYVCETGYVYDCDAGPLYLVILSGGQSYSYKVTPLHN